MAGSTFSKGFDGLDADGAVDVLVGWTAVRVIHLMISIFTDEAAQVYLGH